MPRLGPASSLAEILLVAHIQNGGFLPRQKSKSDQVRNASAFVPAIASHGGAAAVSACLHATQGSLTPFIILITARLAANPDAALALTRDCLTEHPLLERRFVVSWEKGRAKSVQRRSFLRNGKRSLPDLLSQVLEMTAPLQSIARDADVILLFLKRLKSGPNIATRIDTPGLNNFIDRFVARNDLRNDRGEPLHLRMSHLRPTMLGLSHRHLNHDVRKTQLIAGHADAETTQRYVSTPVLREERQIGIAEVQTRMLAWVTGSGSEVAAALSISPGTAAALISGGNATGSGFSCRDPLDSPIAGERKGKLCSAWLGCFTCPNAVIIETPETVLRLVASREALRSAASTVHAERYMALYEPKLRILEDQVLPRFAPAAISAAMERRAEWPSIPEIE